MFCEIIITVADIDAAVDFYTDACRFTYVRTVEHQGAKAVELDADGQRVTLVAGDTPGIRLVLEANNVRADHRRLARRNAAAGEPIESVGGTWLPFDDPWGNHLGYWKPSTPDE
ncbi:MAG TPA: VOC family protein [Egibacteraceae bacterium]|nr:VOC family protein [Egibacteraceae bacterium]